MDGGVSPFNNPALQAFMYATLSGYRLQWPAGEDNVLLVSVGTGAADPSVKHSQVAAAGVLDNDLLGGSAQLTYLRYDADLRLSSLQSLLKEEAATLAIENLTGMDAPEDMEALYTVGQKVGLSKVDGSHVPSRFNLE